MPHDRHAGDIGIVTAFPAEPLQILGAHGVEAEHGPASIRQQGASFEGARILGLG